MSFAEFVEKEKRRYSKLRCPYTRDFCHNESCPMWRSLSPAGCVVVNGLSAITLMGEE